MKSLNKGFVFIVLFATLAVILIIRFGFFTEDDKPSLQERLPNADLIGRIKLLDLVDELDVILQKNKLPIREFASSDYLLSRAKAYGINIKSDAYLFSDFDMKNTGVVLALNDSSKVIHLIELMKRNSSMRITQEGETFIYHFKELNTVLCYGEDYLCLHRGKNYDPVLQYVIHAKKGYTHPVWERLLAIKPLQNEKVLLLSENSNIKKWGFEYATFSYHNTADSLLVDFQLHSSEAHGFKLNNHPKSLNTTKSMQKLLNFNIDPGFRNTPTGKAIIAQLTKIGQKISFPGAVFFETWNGNLSLIEGGKVNTKEKIVTTEFDEDFNPIEVVDFKTVQVPGYSVAFGSVDKGKKFIQKLYTKGLLRDEGQQCRFLYSPLLHRKNDKEYLLFSSGTPLPKLVATSKNAIQWNFKSTNIHVVFTSFSPKVVYGLISAPAKSALQLLQQIKWN